MPHFPMRYPRNSLELNVALLIYPVREGCWTAKAQQLPHKMCQLVGFRHERQTTCLSGASVFVVRSMELLSHPGRLGIGPATAQ